MLWWLSSLALAQNCGALEFLPGPRADLVEDALERNVATYGVLASVDRNLQFTDEEPIAGYYEYNMVADTLRVPGIRCDETVLGAVDVSSLAFGFGGGNHWIRAFYAFGATGHVHNSDPYERSVAHLDVLWVGAYGLAAPVIGPTQIRRPHSEFVFDYMAGVELSPGPANLTVAYIGSSGLYVSGAEQSSTAFARLALDEGLSRLPWWMLGVARLPWPESIEEKAGRTKIFGRNLDWIAARVPPPTAAEEPEAAPEPAGRTPLTTFHVRQTRIRGLFRMAAIGRVRPAAGLHALSGGACTPGDDPRLVACAEIGMTSLPPLYAYGVEGGPKLAFDLEVHSAMSGGVDVAFAIRRNQPEVLDIFPYAQDGTQVSLRVGTRLDAR